MEPVVFIELTYILNTFKKEIDKEPEEWEYRKRQIHSYEPIFSIVKESERSSEDEVWRKTSDDNPRMEWNDFRNRRTRRHITYSHKGSHNMSLSSIHPISRAFFKLIEIDKQVREDIRFKSLFNNPIRILCLAESPGGFIQAWRWKREQEGIIDDIRGITIEKKKGVNPWDRLEEVSHKWKYPPTLVIGDLFESTIRESTYHEYSEEKTKATIVTCDGGFDFSADYCSQEQQATPLILAELVVALKSLKRNGILILKIFDTTTLPMIQLLWVCWKSFVHFRIVKPYTSRPCNSEKYIIAKGFKGVHPGLNLFLARCETLLDSRETITTLFPTGVNSSFDTMDEAFRVNFMNIIGQFMDLQIATIKEALAIDIDEDEDLKYRRNKYNREISREWCCEHNIPISKEYIKVYRRF